MLRIEHIELYQSYLLLLLNLHTQFEIGHPFFILINNSCFSLFDSTGSFAVFTPAISTFLIKFKTPFRNMLFTLFPKGVNFILIYNSRKSK